MNVTEELTYSQKKYLFAIYKLGQQEKDVKSTDVAKLVGVSKASTAAMMTKLTDSGFIEKEYYGRIVLTENGIKAAESIYSNCVVIRSFFEEKLMLEKERADMDAVGIVAHISEETAAKFADYILNSTH
ncbi:MAG: metal-dependent transcriptional regulator [Oscillospiraceae bacterium]|nr:metal-dependent transcriptional regulator [Oscillospiraceae bacterium]